ncbi:MAG: HD domain-containing protein [candidate division WOR-3 bacterium]
MFSKEGKVINPLEKVGNEIKGYLKAPLLKRVLEEIGNLLEDRREYYLVGGAIRDIVLKRAPFDFDLAVAGKGIELASHFAQRIRGKFVLLSEKEDEARVVKRGIDGKIFTFDFKGLVGGEIVTDLKDRDFTINAIAFGPLNDLEKARVFDPFAGLSDIRKKIIRLVSEDALRKDPLRILRAVRFALELNFRIDKNLWSFGREISLAGIARERIAYEVLRILGAKNTYSYIQKLLLLGLLPQIFPSFAFFFQDQETFRHSLLTYKKLESILSDEKDEIGRFFRQFPEWQDYIKSPNILPILKLAALFHDLAKPLTRREEEGEVHFYGHDALGAKLIFDSLKKELRLSNDISERVKRLTLYHMRLHLLATRSEEITERAMRRFLRDLGEDALGLMALTCADGYATARKTKHLEIAIERIINFKREEDKKKNIKRLVTGYDLIDLGLKPGPIFKKILGEIEEMTLEGKIRTKEEGLEYVRKNYLPV